MENPGNDQSILVESKISTVEDMQSRGQCKIGSEPTTPFVAPGTSVEAEKVTPVKRAKAGDADSVLSQIFVKPGIYSAARDPERNAKLKARLISQGMYTPPPETLASSASDIAANECTITASSYAESFWPSERIARESIIGMYLYMDNVYTQ
jgi:hypothetical protein